MKLRDEIRDAFIDYKYFLNRNYSRKIALDAVTTRYNLTKLERLLLYRCVHSDYEIETIRRKISYEREVVIDGYNLALTLLSAINGEEIFLCDDGFFRDLGLGKYKNSNFIIDALIIISEYCEKLNLTCEIILDSQISKSGEIASELRKKNIRAKTVNKADKEVILSNKIIYSNDFLVLYKSQRITNIFNELLIENDFKIIRGPWIVSAEEKL
ncbi:DUF434 domain-containing protein [Saccharolobus caldissimus]|uniref:DUF434 domain-containing protein n=1 Tax=Saccharolobus caldissimus TaxID=1702097 RepID=A0AAQ4CN50_9CREN|nr:DUF434 domain-containing protein [Saccharolobus caldissimus]BDB97231.1 hypothetical protein SACC_02480 [Saccharolobus caldissimus]